MRSEDASWQYTEIGNAPVFHLDAMQEIQFSELCGCCYSERDLFRTVVPGTASSI